MLPSTNPWHTILNPRELFQEHFHQTLKNMLRCYCLEFKKDWDEGVHLLMFAARESAKEALGFSPFELAFGHRVRDPLKTLKETWLSDNDDPDYMVCTPDRCKQWQLYHINTLKAYSLAMMCD